MKNFILILLFTSFAITARTQSYDGSYINYNSSSNLSVSEVTLQPKKTSDNPILGISITGLTDYFKFDNAPDGNNIDAVADGSYLWSEETSPSCPNKFICGTTSSPTTYTDPRVNNTYTTVQIGTQCWFQQNLHETSYVNGDAIPNVTVLAAWNTLYKGAYCWYNNDYTDYGSIYGALYNWYAVNDSRGLCPLGWYVPSYNESFILFNYLGGTALTYTATVLRSTSATLWSCSGAGNNNSGFTALAGGAIIPTGFSSWCYTGCFWTSSSVYGFNIQGSGSPVLPYLSSTYGASPGESVRCVRDN